MKSSLFSTHTFNQTNDSNLSFIDSCLCSSNTRISSASNNAKLIIEKAINDSICDPEILHYEIEGIKQGLSKEESRIIEQFILECVSLLNVSKEDSMKRQLKKERK